MSKNSKLKNFMHIGIGTIFNILLGLITTPVITRLVDTNDYGQLSMFNTYASMAVMVLCLGLDQALIRFYYEYSSNDYHKYIVKITGGLSLKISVVLCILSYFFISKIFVSFDFKGIELVALLLYSFINLFLRFALLILRVEYQTKLYAILNALNKFIYLVIAVLMIVFVKSNNNLPFLIFATIISSLIPLIIAVCKKLSLWNFIGVCNISTNTNISRKDILKYGLPFIMSMGITTIFEALDKLTLNYFCDYSEVGIYSSAVTVVNIFTIIQTTFNTVWAPMSMEHLSSNPNDTYFFKRVNSIISFLMFGFGFTLITFKDIFVLLLGEKYRMASAIVPFLILHPIMYTISETTVIGIDYKKKSYLHVISATLACITNAVGNFYLVPIMGGQGAAISTGISYIVFWGARTFFGLKNYNYKPDIYKIVILIIITLAYAFYCSITQFNIITLLIYFIVIIVLAVLYKSVIIDLKTLIQNKIQRRQK